MNANRIRLNADPKEYSLFSTVRLYIQLMRRSELFALKYPGA